MKKNILVNLAFALAISMTLVDASFALEGAYISGNMGITKQPTLTYRSPDNSGQFLKTENKNGFAGGVALGYQWDNLHMEAAFDYLDNKAKTATTSSSFLPKTNAGKTRATAFMLNGLCDFFDAESSEWTPYLGAGLGLARVSQSIDIDATNNAHGGATKFAYQGIVGISYSLSEFVKTNVDYRYLRVSSAKYDVKDSDFIVPMTAVYNNQRVIISLTAFL